MTARTVYSKRTESAGLHSELGQLRNRVVPLGDLRHHVPFEIVTDIGFAHHRPLASKLGKKASTNPGAVHCGTLSTP